MKLDRNINPDGRGKYALLNLRKNTIEWGDTQQDEFFVIKLKDRYAAEALYAYALEAEDDDAEYAGEVRKLADRAGPRHPLCRRPD